jgi:prephenate dehydrogenase
MTRTIAIIGVGLIGGSFALACKKHGLADKIIGCSRKQATLDEALSLGIIDEGFVDISDAVKDADVVMICTPLRSYGSIAAQMNGHLKDDVIITDAGSVKSAPSKAVLENLDVKHHPNFVPGHPIAGTEKSGPSAAFDSLYDNKKVILTPLSQTAENVTAHIVALWQQVGANVEVLDADRHDFIYATVSHVVQFVSYAYGAAAHDKVGELDDDYRSFVRLAGSSFAMWRDIFLVNKLYVLSAVDLFTKQLDSLLEAVQASNDKALQDHLIGSQQKRRHFEMLLKGSGNEAKFCAVSSKKPDAWKDLLPRIVAAALMDTIAESEYDYATGAGLHSISLPILAAEAVRSQDVIENKANFLDAAKEFKALLENIKCAVKAEDVDVLQGICEQSQAEYARVMAD